MNFITSQIKKLRKICHIETKKYTPLTRMEIQLGQPAPLCFSCGTSITPKKYKKFHKCVQKGELQQDVLDDMGYFRPCCRRMFLGDNHEWRKKMSLYDNSTVDDCPTL